MTDIDQSPESGSEKKDTDLKTMSNTRLGLFVIFFCVVGLVSIVISLSLFNTTTGDCIPAISNHAPPYYSHILSYNSPSGVGLSYCHEFTVMDRIFHFLILLLGLGFIGMAIDWRHQNKPVKHDVQIILALSIILFVYSVIIAGSIKIGVIIPLLITIPFVVFPKFLGIEYEP